MALILPNYYPGRFNAPTAAYPHGSHKNRSTATSNDGSYYEQAWANDIQGFHSQLLSAAGITPSGVPDYVGASDLYDALRKLFLSRTHPFADIKADGAAAIAEGLANLGLGDANGYVGRLINAWIFTSSGTYTPTPGTKRLLVEMVGGGGAGGGAYAGGNSSSSSGAGGSSGAYGKALLTSVSASLSYSVGAGGVGMSGGKGTDGGATTFGTLSVSGGLGGRAFSYGGTVYTDVTSGTGTFSGNFLEAVTGGYSSIGLMLSSSLCFGGGGGNSKIGTGGAVIGLNTAGVAIAGISPSSTDYGAGGGGGVSTSATAVVGGNGGNGVILVWEFA